MDYSKCRKRLGVDEKVDQEVIKKKINFFKNFKISKLNIFLIVKSLFNKNLT